jgi:uncharacterized protein related to proFAR isomerase
MGQRDQYRPIETPLSPTSVAEDVVQGLMSVFAFRSLYVADLDAIERTGANDAILVRLRAAFPRLAFWVDNGVAQAGAAAALLDRGGHLVLGSEAQRDAALLETLRHDPRIVLSLDFRGDSFIGPRALLDQPDLWPERVVVMTLARVGSGAGPDIARLGQIRSRAGDRRIYAAGGVRNRDDLVALKHAGIAGALIASALHDGTLTAPGLRGL